MNIYVVKVVSGKLGFSFSATLCLNEGLSRYELIRVKHAKLNKRTFHYGKARIEKVGQQDLVLSNLECVTNSKAGLTQTISFASSQLRDRAAQQMQLGLAPSLASCPEGSPTAARVRLPAMRARASNSETLVGTRRMCLQELVKEAQSELPLVCQLCFNRLRREEALRTVGLFQDVAAESDLKQAECLMTGEPVDLNQFGPQVAATLLKRFLRALSPPLVPYNSYHSFVDCLNTPRDGGRAQRLRYQVQSLPVENKALFTRLFRDLLLPLLAHAQHNQLTPAHLAVVFGPCLMRTLDPMMQLRLVQKQVELVEYILQDYALIFPEQCGPAQPLPANAPAGRQGKRQVLGNELQDLGQELALGEGDDHDRSVTVEKNTIVQEVIVPTAPAGTARAGQEQEEAFELQHRDADHQLALAEEDDWWDAEEDLEPGLEGVPNVSHVQQHAWEDQDHGGEGEAGEGKEGMWEQEGQVLGEQALLVARSVPRRVARRSYSFDSLQMLQPPPPPPPQQQQQPHRRLPSSSSFPSVASILAAEGAAGHPAGPIRAQSADDQLLYHEERKENGSTPAPPPSPVPAAPAPPPAMPTPPSANSAAAALSSSPTLSTAPSSAALASELPPTRSRSQQTSARSLLAALARPKSEKRLEQQQQLAEEERRGKDRRQQLVEEDKENNVSLLEEPGSAPASPSRGVASSVSAGPALAVSPSAAGARPGALVAAAVAAGRENSGSSGLPPEAATSAARAAFYLARPKGVFISNTQKKHTPFVASEEQSADAAEAAGAGSRPLASRPLHAVNIGHISTNLSQIKRSLPTKPKVPPKPALSKLSASQSGDAGKALPAAHELSTRSKERLEEDMRCALCVIAELEARLAEATQELDARRKHNQLLPNQHRFVPVASKDYTQGCPCSCDQLPSIAILPALQSDFLYISITVSWKLRLVGMNRWLHLKQWESHSIMIAGASMCFWFDDRVQPKPMRLLCGNFAAGRWLHWNVRPESDSSMQVGGNINKY
eukprot:g1075.t1